MLALTQLIFQSDFIYFSQVLQYFSIFKSKMAWYFNFCSPYLPNDPTIQFFRKIQVLILAAFTILTSLIYLYYKCTQTPIDDLEDKSAHEKTTRKKEQDGNQEQDSSEYSSKEDKEKEVSLNLEEGANESCVSLKKTVANIKQTSSPFTVGDKVTTYEIQSYFPIVYGHFAVAMGMSVSYTPYVEQTIASILYIILFLFLMISNSRRAHKCSKFLWILMAGLILFLITCALLEIGQSNWDIIGLNCFANRYVSLYQ